MVVPQTSERERLLKLLAQKDELEARIATHGQVLQTVSATTKQPKGNHRLFTVHSAQNKDIYIIIAIIIIITVKCVRSINYY